MKKLIRKSPFSFILLLVILAVISIIMGVGLGPVSIAFTDVWRVISAKLFGGEITDIPQNVQNIVWSLRLPRVLLGFIVGGGLALAGVAIQAFTKNPLSEPYILGISSGASTGAVFVMLNGALASVLGRYALPIGAFIGAMLALISVYSIAKTREGIVPIRLILVGIAVSAMFSALTRYLVFNAKTDSGVRNATFWMMGSLAGSKWQYLSLPFIILIFAFVVFMILSRAMNTMLLGESTAIILGINVKLARKIIVVISALLAGSIVAVSGSIGFVGLIIPHIVRSLWGSEHRYVIPASLLFGGIFIVFSDVAARLLVAPQELPIGIVTALLGAPYFVYLVNKNKYTFGS